MSHPNVLFINHKGDVVRRGFSRSSPLTKDQFARDLTIAKRAFDVYLGAEENPEDARLVAETLLLDVKLNIRSHPLDDLKEASEAKGVSEDLLVWFKRYADRKPLVDIIEQYNKGKIDLDDANVRMFKIYRSGKRIVDSKDKLFIPFWKYSFDGAIYQKELEASSAILAGYRQHAGTGFGSSTLIKVMEADLEALKATKKAKAK